MENKEKMQGELRDQSKLVTINLPQISYKRQELDEIIDELPKDLAIKINEYLSVIEERISTITRYQSKSHPENFLEIIRIIIFEIHSAINVVYDLIKTHHLSLAHAFKELILKWIEPFDVELEKIIKMLKIHESKLELKTRRLCAEQSFVEREAFMHKILWEHLTNIQELFQEGDHVLYCHISYAWPTRENQEREYWIQPFLSTLYDHLTAVGIRVMMDIRDNNPGDSIYKFFEHCGKHDYIILVGTESLLKKYENDTPYIVQSEIKFILDRLFQNQEQSDQNQICPLLISGTLEMVYPKHFHSTILDARELGYIKTLHRLIDSIYKHRIPKVEKMYLNLWEEFYKNNHISFSEDAVEREINFGYHRQQLNYLRKGFQYQDKALAVELTGSTGDNSKEIFGKYGQEFQSPYTNPSFIMRHELWEKMIDYFDNVEQTTLLLIVCGLGGTGKTALVQYYYQNPRKPYRLRAWFFAEKKEHIYQQYIDLAKAHGIEYIKEMPIEERVKRIKEWLENQKDCLLVYDNVRDPKEIEALLPNHGKHHILITSRNAVDWPVQQILDVDVMEEKEAIALICKITGVDQTEDDLQLLVNTLGCLPLALVQAGAYILVMSLSIKDYLSLYQDYQPKLLTDKLARSEKYEPIWKTFDMNFKALAKDCPAALETLKKASWLNNSAIPDILLKSMLEESSQLVWKDIKKNIKRHSLMHIDVKQQQLKMHPLLQDIFRNKQETAEQIRFFERACNVVDEFIRDFKQNILPYKYILPHAECLFQHGQRISKLLRNKESTEIDLLSVKPLELGTIYQNMGLTRKAEIFYQQQLICYMKSYGKNSVEVAKTLVNLGRAYLDLGDVQKGKLLYDRALSIQKTHYGKNHVIVAETLTNLARAYLDLGDTQKGKILCKHALKIQVRHYDVNHHVVAETLVNLGKIYLSLGKPQKAKSLFKRALAIQEIYYDVNHHVVAETLVNLGKTYLSLGKPQKARLLLDRALVIQSAYYGKVDVVVAETLTNLGNTYLYSGKSKKGKELFERALIIKEAYYGKDHPAVAEVLINLGNTYLTLQETQEGIKLFEHALIIREAYYGKGHIEVAKVLVGLGNAYLDLKKIQMAVELLTKAFLIKKDYYGENHPEIAAVLVNLGNNYSVLGQVEKGKIYLEQALKIMKNFYIKDHIGTAGVLYNLAIVNMELKDFTVAQNYLERAQTIYKNFFIGDHPQLIKIEILLKTISTSKVNDVFSVLTYLQQSDYVSAVIEEGITELRECSSYKQKTHITSGLELYVPLFGCNPDVNPYAISDSEKLVLLQDIIRRDFFNGKERVLLLTGEAGSGKTLFGCYLENFFWDKFKNFGDSIVVFISLPQLQTPIYDLINEHFTKQCGETKAQEIVNRLKIRKRVYFVLDAYDEVQSFQEDLTNVKNLYESNQLHQWKEAKFIISCRTSFLNRISNLSIENSYKKYFVPIESDEPRYDLLKIVQVALFNDNQIQEYIDKHVALQRKESPSYLKWTVQQYREQIKILPNVRELVKLPLFLMVTVQGLSMIVSWYDTKKEINLSSLSVLIDRNIFLSYLKYSLVCQEKKLIQNGRSVPGNLKTAFLGFLVNLSNMMVKNKLLKVMYKFPLGKIDKKEVEQGPKWAQVFFGDPFLGQNESRLKYLETIRNSLSEFLIYENGAWRFVHESFINKFDSINIIELAKIRVNLKLTLGFNEARRKSIEDFSRIFFESEDPYYLTGKQTVNFINFFESNKIETKEKLLEDSSLFDIINSTAMESKKTITQDSVISNKADVLMKSQMKNNKITTFLPEIAYNREELDEIIGELKIAFDIKIKLLVYLENIEQQLADVRKYQAMKHLENFYQAMRAAVQEIRNTTTAIYDLTEPYHQTLPNTLKELILEWITPLEAELEKRIEMPVSNRDELDLKTKYLYAEQSFISRQASPQQALMRHLEKLKELLLVSGHPSPRCYISYAWPSEQHKAQEYWVQPFLFVLYDHLKAAGIRVVMDIRDNNPGDSIYQFMKQYHEGNYIILVGTESLLQKHYGKRAHAVQTELSIINNRFEQDQSQFGQSRIYPMLISGTMKSAYPEIYDKYRTVRDARDVGYVGTLKKLIDWIYEASVKQKASEHSGLWQSFYHQYSGLPKENSVVEQELSLGYHGQRLEFLRQDIQYQAVQAQEQTQHSQAVQAEQIGALMKSQGSKPLFYDANGVQFQRPYANPDFIMRQGLWDKMTSHFEKSDQQILTLTAHGLGGMGKTELAQYYYQHPPRPYTLRAWFYAKTKEHLYQQYVDLAAEHPEGMKFPKETPIEEKVKHIKQWLEKQKDCLLIYDNVPDAKEIEALLPNMGKHHILITSRNAVDWPVHQILDIDVMEETEAIALICKITGYREDDSSIKQLVETLGCLPLALTQAGAYMAVKSLSIEDYLKLYQDYKPRLLTDKPVRGTKHEPIWTTFDINFRALEKNCPEALETLKQASWLGSSAIPEILLLSMVTSTEDKRLIWNDIKEQLKRYSLMRIDVEQKQFNVHPIIQDILREQQNEIEKIAIFKEICGHINALFQCYQENNFSYRGLLSHAERLHEHADDIAQIAKNYHTEKYELFLLKPVCLESLYLNLRLDFKALEFLTKAEKIREKTYGKEHIETAATLNNLGTVYTNLGKPLEAKSYYERALRIQESHYGKDHVETASVLVNLGIVWRTLRQSLKAKSYYKRALRMQEFHYGKDHIETAKTLANLGNVYQNFGKSLKAKSYYERVLKIQESYYGKEHIEMATTLGNLGIIWQVLGKSLEAKSYYKRALRMQEFHYGKDHIETAKTLEKLGYVCQSFGKPLKAKSYYERSLRIQESHYGEEHVEMATTLENLGTIYRTLGQPLEAKFYYERALRMQEAYYGKDNFEIAVTLGNLGTVYQALDQLWEAKSYYERSLRIQESHYGEEHVEMATTLENLGVVYEVLGQPLEAKLYYEKVLRIKEFYYGQEHIETATTLGNLGNVCQCFEKFLEAKSYYERALRIQELHYGKNHVETALTLENLGFFYQNLNQFEDAIQYLERAKAIYRKNFTEDYPNLLRVEQALKAIKLALSDVGNQHLKTSSSAEQPNADLILRLKTLSLKLNKQAVSYFQAKEYLKALPCFEEALKLQQQISDVPNEEVATLHFNIGSTYFFQNNYQSAIAILQIAHGLRRGLLGDSHEATKKAENRLRACEEAIVKTTEVLNESILQNNNEPSVLVTSSTPNAPPLVFSRGAARNESPEQAPQPPLTGTFGSGFKPS